MRSQFVVRIGADLVAASLPAGEVRSVSVDNPSGSWLQLFPTYDYVPPYTLGFQRTFEGIVASITLRFTSGPSGQVSTAAGDPVVVILDSDAQGNSAGISAGAGFIHAFTPLQSISLKTTFTPGTPFNQVVVSSLVTGTTKRLRLHSASLATRALVEAPLVPMPINASIGPFPPGPYVMLSQFAGALRIAGAKMHDEIAWSPALDVDAGIECYIAIGAMGVAGQFISQQIAHNGVTFDCIASLLFEVI